MIVKEIPIEQRPREKALLRGIAFLSDAELLAIILQVGRRGTDVVSLCKKLIEESGGLYGLSTSSYTDIKEKGVGKAKKLKIMALFELGRRANDSYYVTHKVASSKDAAQMSKFLASESKEKVLLICLDKKRNLIKSELIVKGDESKAEGNIKEVLKRAINFSSAYVYLIHNHPSGSLLPSTYDEMTTRALIEAFQSVGITMIDHLIITKGGFYSLRDRESFPYN